MSAFEQLKSQLQTDSDLAFGWHCTVACCFRDSGASHEKANKAAAEFMKIAFDIDMRDTKRWKQWEEMWKNYPKTADLSEAAIKIVGWAVDRGILSNSDPKSQFLKMISEIGELADAISHQDDEEIEDALGDVFVTLVLTSELLGKNLHTCVDQAYQVISKRKGKMQNGVFVKSE